MNLVFKTNKINNTALDYDVENCEYTNNGFHNANHESSCAINLKHLYFCEPIQNSIIHDSYFIRMNYSDNDVSCKLETLILEKYSNFLNSANNSNTLKIPVYNLSTQLKSCSIKLFSEIDKRTQECNIILKISGIWENIREYGITFKFMDLHS
jgi:hypothetical protein